MFLEMSHRQLLKARSALQTCHCMFGNALPPVDWLWWYLWRCNSNATVRVFLCFEGLQTGIGLLKGLMHLLGGECVRFNLCQHEVFRHCEQGLGHETLLGMGGWKARWRFVLTTLLCMGRYPQECYN